MALDLRQTVKTSVQKGHPILGVGPMSKNCVDAALKVSELSKTPIFLIASRRQIDSSVMGGGYVNNWSTETFADYVRAQDRAKMTFLCRDHGGPWQNPKEQERCSDYSSAIRSAIASFKTDIDAGFDLIHIDPIFNRDGSCVSSGEALNRAIEIQQELHDYALRQGRTIEFEFGTEEQSALPNQNKTEVREHLDLIETTAKKRGLAKPLFSVFQTGTKVMETSNCGAFPQSKNLITEFVREQKIPESIALIRSYDIEVKEHNGDFLSDDALRWRVGSQIGGLNVAPEFGQVETQTYMNLMEKYDRRDLLESFYELADASKKWVKWTDHPENLTVERRALIAGHYLFTTPNFLEIRHQLLFEARRRGDSVDEILVDKIMSSIRRYLFLIGWS